MVAQAVMAAAMSSASPMRFSSVEALTLSLKSAPRPGDEFGVDHARRDCEDPDLRRQHAGQRLGHHVDPGLGGAIGDRGRPR